MSLGERVGFRGRGIFDAAMASSRRGVTRYAQPARAYPAAIWVALVPGRVLAVPGSA